MTHRSVPVLIICWRRLPEVAQPPSFAAQGNPLRDTYYWYNATQVMFHMQGEHWEKWQGRLYPLLATTQIDEGDFAGSWSPSDPVPTAGPRRRADCI